MDIENVDISTAVVEDVDLKDYPDFCDAYIVEASFQNGTRLTEEELEELNEDNDGLTNRLAHESLYE